MTVVASCEAPRLSIVGTAEDGSVAGLVPTLVFDPVNPGCPQTRSLTVANSSALDLPFRWAAAPRKEVVAAATSAPRSCSSPACTAARYAAGESPAAAGKHTCYTPSCRARRAAGLAFDVDNESATPHVVDFAVANAETLELLGAHGGAFTVDPCEGMLPAHSAVPFTFTFASPTAPRVASAVCELLVSSDTAVVESSTFALSDPPVRVNLAAVCEPYTMRLVPPLVDFPSEIHQGREQTQEVRTHSCNMLFMILLFSHNC
jgi:hypothetical protein